MICLEKLFPLKAGLLGLATAIVSTAVSHAQDSVPAQAIELLGLSLACPADQYTAAGAPFDHRLDRNRFAGNASEFIILTSRDHILTWPAADPNDWHDTIRSSIKYSDIAQVKVGNGAVMKIQCNKGRCIRTNVERPKYSGFDSTDNSIEIKLCDDATAQNAKAALEALEDVH